jgi:hypothetical protein
MEAVFPAQFMPRLYNEDQLSLQESHELAFRRIGGSSEMAASLRGRELGVEICQLLEDITKQRRETRD